MLLLFEAKLLKHIFTLMKKFSFIQANPSSGQENARQQQIQEVIRKFLVMIGWKKNLKMAHQNAFFLKFFS